jgi:hypothetical protein
MVRLSPPGHGRIEFAGSLEVHVGGGDGFASGFAYGFLTGTDPQTAVNLGTAHGARRTAHYCKLRAAIRHRSRSRNCSTSPAVAVRGLSGKSVICVICGSHLGFICFFSSNHKSSIPNHTF